METEKNRKPKFCSFKKLFLLAVTLIKTMTGKKPRICFSPSCLLLLHDVAVVVAVVEVVNAVWLLSTLIAVCVVVDVANAVYAVVDVVNAVRVVIDVESSMCCCRCC